MFSCEYSVTLKAPVRLLVMGGTDILLMRFGIFTIEIKWKFTRIVTNFVDV